MVEQLLIYMRESFECEKINILETTDPTIEEVKTAAVVRIKVCDLVHSDIYSFLPLVGSDNIQLRLQRLGVFLFSAKIVNLLIFVVENILVGSGVCKSGKSVANCVIFYADIAADSNTHGKVINIKWIIIGNLPSGTAAFKCICLKINS